METTPDLYPSLSPTDRGMCQILKTRKKVHGRGVSAVRVEARF